MRLPVDRNADLKKCLFCSSYINGQCEGLPVEVTDNRYELLEGHIQEVLKEANIDKTVLDLVKNFVPKTKQNNLADWLESNMDILIDSIVNAVYQTIENKLDISAKVSPDTEFYCKNWR